MATAWSSPRCWGRIIFFFTSMNLEVSTRSSTEHISYMLQSVKSNSCWFHRLGRRIAFFEESCWNTMRNWLFNRYLIFRHQFIYLSFIQYQMKLWYTRTLFTGAVSFWHKLWTNKIFSKSWTPWSDKHAWCNNMNLLTSNGHAKLKQKITPFHGESSQSLLSSTRFSDFASANASSQILS